jgi:hypothetical protein
MSKQIKPVIRALEVKDYSDDLQEYIAAKNQKGTVNAGTNDSNRTTRFYNVSERIMDKPTEDDYALETLPEEKRTKISLGKNKKQSDFMIFPLILASLKDYHSNEGDLTLQRRVDLELSFVVDTISCIGSYVCLGKWRKEKVEIHFPVGYFDVMSTVRKREEEIFRLNYSTLKNVHVSETTYQSIYMPGYSVLVVLPQMITEDQCIQTFISYKRLVWQDPNDWCKVLNQKESICGVTCSPLVQSLNPTYPTTLNLFKQYRSTPGRSMIVQDVVFLRKIVVPIFINEDVPLQFYGTVLSNLPKQMSPSPYIIELDITWEFVRSFLPKAIVDQISV